LVVVQLVVVGLGSLVVLGNYHLQILMQEMKIHYWPATREGAILETMLLVHTENTEY
jgi:hypothetical protein